MTREHSAGCITFKTSVKGPLFAMILDRFGCWTFPKGHSEEGESAFAAALRELQEEAGIRRAELITRLGKSRHSFDSAGERIEKKTEWFLVRVGEETELKTADESHVQAAKWLNPSQALNRLGYANLKPLLRLASNVVKSAC
jgi:8-oxo-dGTP pyrophosphatase MutT (NUDIX family)